MHRGIRIALLGLGKIGREFVTCSMYYPEYQIVALSDTSGVLHKKTGFKKSELTHIIREKENKQPLESLSDRYRFSENIDTLQTHNPDAVIDVTASQTYPILYSVIKSAHIISSNKIPFSETSYYAYKRLQEKASENDKILDIGTTVGAGLQAPNLLKTLPDGVTKVTGCLSGTMNYISQRINENIQLSSAIIEAMKPPRNYTEPDPRIDLSGKDFARKLVILSRLAGKKLELNQIYLQDIIPTHLKKVSQEEFLKNIEDVNLPMQQTLDHAKNNEKALWFLGTADLESDKYSIEFKEISYKDPISRGKESDNIIRFYPNKWRRPITIAGPGAGVPETVSGLISGVEKLSILY